MPNRPPITSLAALHPGGEVWVERAGYPNDSAEVIGVDETGASLLFTDGGQIRVFPSTLNVDVQLFLLGPDA